MIYRVLFWLALFVPLACSAMADERILDYQSDIEVFADGSMQVTETIRVRAEQKEIKRGIYRDFPADYKDRFGNRYRVDFEVLEAKRDGHQESWHSKAQGNGVRVYLGDKNIYLDKGDYTYAITYRTNRQLGFFDDHDELYWNVTGNHWSFPIEAVSARVTLPEGLRAEQLEAEAYTGPLGAKGQDYSASVDYDASVGFKKNNLIIKQIKMKNKIAAVTEFHTAFKLNMNQQPIADIGEDRNTLRFNLMKEENEEYLEAAQNNDLVEVADALGDMLYILCGTIIEHGMQDKIEAVFNEIQRSNMSKLDEDGQPIFREDGKVMKGPNYFKPNISKILNS